jgi:hypothetical protein
MASTTRSTRRHEPGNHQQGNNVAATTASAAAMQSRTAVLHQAPNGGGGAGGRTSRTKRSLDERDFDTIKPKKSRIAVEILSKPRAISHAVNNKAATTAAPTHDAKSTAAPRVANMDDEAKQTAQKSDQTPVAPPKKEQNITKHQSKVINGMKHELDRLQPQASDANKREGRKLRSQEATKFKSELSAYFPDYDEVIGNEPKQQRMSLQPAALAYRPFHFTSTYSIEDVHAPQCLNLFLHCAKLITDLLSIDTPIVITDTASNNRVASHNGAQLPHQQHFNTSIQTNIVRGYSDALYTDVYGSQRINLGFLEGQRKIKQQDDPLPDNLFIPVHKRAERLEKSIRNTERGRAQHEKDRIIHLLEGLQGHDWLRVMGVSGVTETKKKEFQAARLYFMKGCQGILDKFRNWTLEEKRRKAEKERALAADEDKETDSAHSQNDEDSEEVEEDEDDATREATEDHSSVGGVSEASSPAKQLREEALARSKLSAKTIKRTGGATRLAPPPKPAGPPKEFKSFFSKRYERETALHQNRRAGRKVLAWGQPIPELPQSDFMLPHEYRDEDTLKMRARKKRRDKRNSRP